MCTLIAAVQIFPSYPLVIAANRDEDLHRPATPPFLWPGPLPFVAPRDEAAGGTWLGLNAAGLFVGITNRFGVPKDPRRSSRGQLVTEALLAPSASVLHQQLAGLAPARFNAFHLLYADRTTAYVTWSDGERVLQETLPPGVHIVTERSLGGDDRARTELIRKRWPRIQSEDELLDELPMLLGVHTEDPLGSICVHAPALNYGTRSSLILLLAASLGRSQFLWAEGSPCQVPYRDQARLLQELDQAAARHQ